MEIMTGVTKDEDLYDKTIEDVFDEVSFDSILVILEKPCSIWELAQCTEMKLYFRDLSSFPDFGFQRPNLLLQSAV